MWKAIGITIIVLMAVGITLAASNRTTNWENSETVPSRTPDPNTVPTRTLEPSPTDNMETIEPHTSTPSEMSETTNPGTIYLPFIHRSNPPPPTPTPVAPSDECGLLQEAENGQLFGNMRVAADSNASGGQYISVATNEEVYNSIDPNQRADYCVTISNPGEYIIRGWTSSADVGSDSFYVRINGAPNNGYLWETPKNNNFVADYVNDRGKSDPQVVTLSAGTHTLSIYQRESNTKLDRFEFIKANQPPSATATPGSGGGAEITPTPTPRPGEPSTEPIEGNLDGWPMAGANVQRTSWVPDGVDPRAYSNFGVKWYRPVQPYIGQNVQLIAGRDKIFVSTAKGLYAVNADTGATAWQFDTDLPLGHSPTLDGDRIFVGGFDRRVYALNADTGQLIWEFTGAKAGYSTNPIVVDGKVLLGSRDGYFYAIDRSNGQLSWQYPRANEAPLGPIMFSPAYKDGKVFFASNDNYGYALNVSNGSLAWKSEKMPGDGYQAYWPVIYKNFVIFSASMPYANEADIGIRSVETTGYGFDLILFFQRDDIYNYRNDNVQGRDFAAYLERKPWRKSTIVLNTSNGQEYTQDVNNNGTPDFAPFLFTGTKSTNKYPPVVLNGELYAQNMSRARDGWNYSRGALSKWTEGSADIEFVGMEYAIDEPISDSGAGNMLYQNLCCDRVGTWHNLADGKRGDLWNYNKTLETFNNNEPQQYYQHNLAPGYDDMWWGSSMYGQLPRLEGAYGGINGIYHNHAIQNPMIPYKDMLFVHRSNAIIAFGPNSVDLDRRGANEGVEAYEARIRNQYPNVSLPVLTSNNAASKSSLLTNQDVQTLLDQEIEKMLNAGHLMPGYYNATVSDYEELKHYFENPGETLITLVEAYPKVSSSLQPRLKTYIDEHYNRYFSGRMYSYTGHQGLAHRTWMPIPPEVQGEMNARGPIEDVGHGVGWRYPQYNIYAMWKYAELFYSNNPSKLNEIYSKAKQELDTTPVDGRQLEIRAWLANGYIAGYTGFLNLQQMAGQSSADASLRNEVQNALNSQLSKRGNQFEKNQPFITVTRSGEYFNRDYNVARNFIYLTPELADYWRSNAYNKVNDAINEYEYTAPYWMATRYEASVRENGTNNLYTQIAMFKAKALFQKESPAELRKYIDSSAFAVGDLHYIQSLTLALEP